MEIQVDNKIISFKNACWMVYDLNYRCIYLKDFKGSEYWQKYHQNNKKMNSKYSDGFEVWFEYGMNARIHFKNSDGYESWSEHGEHNKIIHYKNSDGGEKWYAPNGKVISKEEFDELFEIKTIYVLRNKL